jgi:hypothetical protein
MSALHTLPATESEIIDFLAAFEDGTLPKERWTHGAHLLAGAWYVHQFGEARALDHMRTCVQRYNLAVGGQNTATDGYHETVTVFWIKLLHAYLQLKQPIDPTAFATAAVDHFIPQRDIYRRYYDYDIVASTEARSSWFPPNLQPIAP